MSLSLGITYLHMNFVLSHHRVHLPPFLEECAEEAWGGKGGALQSYGPGGQILKGVQVMKLSSQWKMVASRGEAKGLAHSHWGYCVVIS